MEVSGVKINVVFTRGARLGDHWQPVVCTVYLNDIPLCQANCARVARPHAGDAIHPALGKGAVWFTVTRVFQCYMLKDREGLVYCMM